MHTKWAVSGSTGTGRCVRHQAGGVLPPMPCTGQVPDCTSGPSHGTMAPNRGRGRFCNRAMLVLLLPLTRPCASKLPVRTSMLLLLPLGVVLLYTAPASGSAMSMAGLRLVTPIGRLQALPGAVLVNMAIWMVGRSGRAGRRDELLKSLLLRRMAPGMLPMPMPAKRSMLQPLYSTPVPAGGTATHGCSRQAPIPKVTAGTPKEPSTPPAGMVHAGGSASWVASAGPVSRAVASWDSRSLGAPGCASGGCWPIKPTAAGGDTCSWFRSH